MNLATVKFPKLAQVEEFGLRLEFETGIAQIHGGLNLVKRRISVYVGSLNWNCPNPRGFKKTENIHEGWALE